MSDIFCTKCGEPWDGYGVREATDMSREESNRFLKGEGCPCCQFGTVCQHCSGSTFDSRLPTCPHNCSPMNAMILGWRPTRRPPRFSNDIWRYGYDPKVCSMPLDAKMHRQLPAVTTRDGVVHKAFFLCPHCTKPDREDTCVSCNGTGKLTVDPELELIAAKSELDYSDEEPIGIMERRGLLRG